MFPRALRVPAAKSWYLFSSFVRFSGLCLLFGCGIGFYLAEYSGLGGSRSNRFEQYRYKSYSLVRPFWSDEFMSGPPATECRVYSLLSMTGHQDIVASSLTALIFKNKCAPKQQEENGDHFYSETIFTTPSAIILNREISFLVWKYCVEGPNTNNWAEIAHVRLLCCPAFV